MPERFDDAIAFNEMLMRDAGVGMTPGSAFGDSEDWEAFAISASSARIRFSKER